MDTQATIRVRVTLLGFLAQLAQQTMLELRIEPGATVAGLVQLLADQCGPSFRQALLDWHGNLHGGIELVLNREPVSARRISKIELYDDSDLIIMPLVGGGQGIRFI